MRLGIFTNVDLLADAAAAGYYGRISVEDNNGLLGGKEPLVKVYRAVRAYVTSLLSA